MIKHPEQYIMPGEFEEHNATLILWPYRSDIWRNGAIYAEREFAKVANIISKFEHVIVGVIPKLYERAKSLLNNDIVVLKQDYNDAWIRDSGPVFVKNKHNRIVSVDWRFNAWGGESKGLYSDYSDDDQLTKHICNSLNIENEYVIDFILEGGAIHVDGKGTLITTKECLLDNSRNGYSIEIVERTLKFYLGVEKIIWLDYGLDYDETCGHIDNICCFARPGEIMLAYTTNQNHPNYLRTYAAYELLKNETDVNGNKLKIHLIDLPDPVKMTPIEVGQKDNVFSTTSTTIHDLLPASYINFYFCNDAIILPLFDIPLDNIVINKFNIIFPKRKIIGISSREILLGGGNIHCITQQIPRSLL